MEQQQRSAMGEDHASRQSNLSGIESSSVLFEKAVPVRIKSPSEDRTAELTIRILMGLSKHRRSTKVLQLQITNELDPFFLYSLEVNEEDFQSLKVEQCILVDFGTFPHKFIELLEHCVRAGAVESPRFLAILNVRTGDSTFSVVETNQFKHLSHLSLCFRQGNDSTIKTYLAGRLAEYKGANYDLHEKLRRTLETLEGSLQDISKLRSELAEFKELHSRSISELQLKHARELAQEKQQVVQECLEMKDKLEREKSDMEQRLLQRAGLQESHVAALDQQVRELTSTRHSLEIKLAELKTKLDLLDKELQDRQQECDDLRLKNKSLEKEVQSSTKQSSDDRVRLAALEQEVQSKVELMSSLSAQLESAASRRAALELSLKEAQTTAEKAEEKACVTALESNKCNQTIEKLQVELKASKAKLKLKTQVTAQQETLLQERQATVERNSSENTTLKQQIGNVKEENESLRKKADELQKKFDEAQEFLKSNQQMIQWLNQQLTDAQLGKYTTKYTNYKTTSRALSLPSHTSSSISQKTPLLPSNVQNLLHQLRPSTPSSINSKSSICSKPALVSKVSFKPPLNGISSSTAEVNNNDKDNATWNHKDRKVVTLEVTRNGLPKPQLSFVTNTPSSDEIGRLPLITN